MHSFPAELPRERLGILLPSKAKDLVPLLPNNRVTEAPTTSDHAAGRTRGFSSYCAPVHSVSINATQEGIDLPPAVQVSSGGAPFEHPFLDCP